MAWMSEISKAVFVLSTRMQRLSFRSFVLKIKAQTFILSLCWELSFGAAKWWEAVFVFNKGCYRSALGSIGKGGNVPVLFLLLKAGSECRVELLILVCAVIYRSLCHQRFLLTHHIWQKGNKAAFKRSCLVLHYFWGQVYYAFIWVRMW